MNKKRFVTVFTLSLLLLALAACNPVAKLMDSEDVIETEAVNVQATVDAAIAATTTAQADFDEEVEVSVQATVQAMPSLTPQPTTEPDEITEEELAEMVDEAVDEAMAASQQTYYTTSDAAYDGTISEEELYYMDYYMYAAELALMYADDLIMMYYDLYGAYAYEAIEVMMAMEDDLVMIAQSLDDIDEIITQGAEYASEAINELNMVVDAAQEHHAEIAELKTGWLESVEFELDERTQEMVNLDPSEIATNREGTITLIHEFKDAIQVGFEDGRISPDELFDIAQRGINAQFSIQEIGGVALQRFSGDISGLTEQLSRGQWPQAQRSMPSFEGSLPSRPSAPNIGLPRR